MAGQLLKHCASFGCGKAIRGFVTGDWRQEIQDSTEEDHLPRAEGLPSVKSVPQALEPLGGRPEPRHWLHPGNPGEVRLRMIAHLGQHKGPLFYYLRLLGEDVTTIDLWGPPGARAPSNKV